MKRKWCKWEKMNKCVSWVGCGWQAQSCWEHCEEPCGTQRRVFPSRDVKAGDAYPLTVVSLWLKHVLWVLNPGKFQVALNLSWERGIFKLSRWKRVFKESPQAGKQKEASICNRCYQSACKLSPKSHMYTWKWAERTWGSATTEPAVFLLIIFKSSVPWLRFPSL